MWNTYLTSVVVSSLDLWHDARGLVKAEYMDGWERTAAALMLDSLRAAHVDLAGIIHIQIQSLSLPGFVKTAIEKVVGNITDDPDKVHL